MNKLLLLSAVLFCKNNYALEEKKSDRWSALNIVVKTTREEFESQIAFEEKIKIESEMSNEDYKKKLDHRWEKINEVSKNKRSREKSGGSRVASMRDPNKS